MPLPLAAIAFDVGSAFVAIGASAGAAAAIGTVVAGLAEVAFAVGVEAALGSLTGLLGKKRGTNTSPAPNVTLTGTITPRQMVYGEAMTGGYLAFYDLGGDKGQYLYFVIVYATHQCESIGDASLDTRYVKASDIDPSTGIVSTTLKDAANNLIGFNGYLKVTTYLGTSDQAVDPEVSYWIPAWDASHRGNGIAYRVFRMEYNLNVYPDGAPQAFSSLVKGRRLYDPRQDSTNGGSGTQRASDPTSWTWSNNAALCVRDYLTGGSRIYDNHSETHTGGLSR